MTLFVRLFILEVTRCSILFTVDFSNSHFDDQGVETEHSDDLLQEQKDNEEAIHEMATEIEVDFAAPFFFVLLLASAFCFWLLISGLESASLSLCR